MWEPPIVAAPSLTGYLNLEKEKRVSEKIQLDNE
jgi:hypothetical protein